MWYPLARRMMQARVTLSVTQCASYTSRHTARHTASDTPSGTASDCRGRGLRPRVAAACVALAASSLGWQSGALACGAPLASSSSVVGDEVTNPVNTSECFIVRSRVTYEFAGFDDDDVGGCS